LPAVAVEKQPADIIEDGAKEFDFVASLVEPLASGPEALEQLAGSALESVAGRAGMTVDRLTSYLEQDLARVSPNGFVTFVDEWDVSDHDHELDADTTSEVPGDPVNGSRPDASHTLFIDFDGHTIENTEWNAAYDVDSIEVGAYEVDDDFKYVVWERIAQDYAPFDVNVTISDPGPDALFKSSADDNEYGSHLLVVPDSSVLPPALQGAGGWAFVGGFASEYLSPALVLADNLQDNAAYIADAGSHEVGHELGLDHHGIDGEEYYYGDTPAAPDALWGPIMGAGYTVPLSTWSDGGYADATNPGQDDIATILDRDGADSFVLLYDGNGDRWTGGVCGYRDGELVQDGNFQQGDEFFEPVDDLCQLNQSDHQGDQLTDQWEYMDRTDRASDPHGDDTGDATSLDNSTGEFAEEGVIVSESDVDVFSVVTEGGDFTATATPVGAGANLDVKLSLLDGDGNVLDEVEQETTVDPTGYPGDPAALGLDATIDAELEAGVYYIQVEGRGQGDPAANTPSNGSGYTDYASLGFYELTGAAEPFEAEPVVITSPEDGAEVEADDLEVTGTAEAEASVTLTVDGETVGSAEADAEGAWSTTLEESLPYGESTITAQQTVGTIEVPETDSVTVTVALDAPVIVKPEEGDTATTATPTFSGTGISGATVVLDIVCNDGEFTLTAEADEPVDDEGAWSLTPGEDLPNGDCTVQAVQTVGDAVSPNSELVNFSVNVDDPGDEDGTEEGDEDGTEDGTEEGDEDGDDLPDTGSGNLVGLMAGLMLLAAGAALYARTRRATV
jgi:LPXTG-motif cell wall-anchored protein